MITARHWIGCLGSGMLSAMTSLMFWNLYETSRELYRGDDRHWREQVAVIKRHQPDILAVTECWDWQHDDHALYRRAQEDLGFADSAFYEAKTNCNMAVFCSEGIELLSSAGQPQSNAFWHGYLRTSLSVPGIDDPVKLIVAHLNPFDPTLRRIEGSWLRVAMRGEKPGILVMDANTVAPGDPEPSRTLNRDQVGEDECDRTPLAALAQVGLIDVGAQFDDRQPTFGYHGTDSTPRTFADFKTRIDQAWVTPSVNVSDYSVIDPTQGSPETDTASDHRPIMINFS